MKIKDRLDFASKPKPVTFRPDDTVRAALNVMCEKNIGSIIVVNDDNKVAGIVTERDMMIRVLGQDKNPDKTKISDIMSEAVRKASLDDDLVDWLKVMSNERFRHLPIVDSEGRLVNMMSQGDFVAFTYPDLYEKVRQDLAGRLGKTLQIFLIVAAVVTLGFIAFQM